MRETVVETKKAHATKHPSTWLFVQDQEGGENPYTKYQALGYITLLLK